MPRKATTPAPAVSDSMATKKKKYMSSAKAASWAVTIQTKGDDELADAPDFDPACMHYYMCVKHEGDETHREHWHLFVQFKSQKTMHDVKEWTSLPHCHCEPVRSTANYLKYLQDGHTTIEGPYEEGTKVTQGHRTDFERLVSMAKDGASKPEIYSANPGLLRYTGAVNAACQELAPKSPAWRTVTVYYIWGTAGVGKTRHCHDIDPDLYKVVCNGKWWDGYTNQKSILFDDYDSAIPFADFLTYLDGYAIQLPIKYGFTYAHWTNVFITANNPPEFLYKNFNVISPEQRAGLDRRISEVIHLE